MKRIVHLLQEKNQHLESFFRLNSEEMGKFMEGNFENLEVFYQSRETLLEMIRVIDSMIEESQRTLDPKDAASDEDKRGALRALNQKNDLVTQILAQDLQILSVIESAKSKIIRELSQVRAGRKAVGAYKSGDSDSNLDEEA